MYFSLMAFSPPIATKNKSNKGFPFVTLIDSIFEINELVAEANGKVMSFVSCQLDPLFESSDLKATGTGTYQEVFDTVDYDNKSGADVVDVLLDGMSAVGYTV